MPWIRLMLRECVGPEQWQKLQQQLTRDIKWETAPTDRFRRKPLQIVRSTPSPREQGEHAADEHILVTAIRHMVTGKFGIGWIVMVPGPNQ